MKKMLLLAASFVFAAGALTLVQAIALAQDAEATKPKHTIKEVMEAAHKGGLLEKVSKGEASAEEKSELLDLYISLSDSEPPLGDPEDFKKLANAAVVAAARVVVGRDGAEEQLKKGVNCAVCHKGHKPPSE